MNAKTIRNGAVIGAVAGMMMAMWSMVALAVTGHGFWAPVNAIAHTVWDSAPLDGTFDVAALLFTGRLAQTMHAHPTWSTAIQQAAAGFFVNSDAVSTRPASADPPACRPTERRFP